MIHKTANNPQGVVVEGAKTKSTFDHESVLDIPYGEGSLPKSMRRKKEFDTTLSPDNVIHLFPNKER